MDFGTWFSIKTKGKLVGNDEQGNRYFEERRTPKGRRKRRWVAYKGKAEGSKVPPLWHAWLHHTIAEPPADEDIRRYQWQKDHQPNRTGTMDAYRPSGHDYEGGQRAPGTGDYEPWRPA